MRPLAAAGAIWSLIPGAVFGPHLISRAWHSFTRPPASSSQHRSDGAAEEPLELALPDMEGGDSRTSSAHPVGGTGAGTFAFWWNQHGTHRRGGSRRAQHLAREPGRAGAPGLLLIVAVSARGRTGGRHGDGFARGGRVTAGAAARARRIRRLPVHASIDWMWESTATTVLASRRYSDRWSETPRDDSFRLARAASRAAAALFAAGCGILSSQAFCRTTEIRHSQAAEQAGNASVGALLGPRCRQGRAVVGERL